MTHNTPFSFRFVFVPLFCILGLVACRVERPKDILTDRQMEGVLYDYHLAKAMAEEVPRGESYKRALYVQAVFQKHGITEAQFDSSLAWYSRNPEALIEVYGNVTKRLDVEKNHVKDLIALRDNKPRESLAGDSVDVWAWQRAYRLTGMPLGNLIEFVLPSDVNFRSTDTLRWQARFRLMRPLTDTALVPIMAMQIAYESDTTVSCLRRVTKDGMQQLSLWADSLGGIKEVSGFVYYPLQDSVRPLQVDRIALMRYHSKDSAVAVRPSASSSSASVPRGRVPRQRSSR